MNLAVPLDPVAQGPLDVLSRCLAARGHATSRALLAGLADEEPDAWPRRLAELGVAAQWIRPRALTDDLLPALALLLDGSCATIVAGDEQGVHSADRAEPLLPGEILRLLVIAPPAAAPGRASDLVPDAPRGWFWPTLWQYRRYYLEAAILSAVINLLSLAGIVFMMTVYDRILPNLAFVTLWSLLAGVGLALLFEFVARTLRGHVLDSAGKKIDLLLGDLVFTRVLGTALASRAQSSGAFANILKEFESVRGFVSSASLVGLADLPFAFLFLFVCWLIGGALVLVPLGAFVLITILSLAIQPPMARLARENLREAAVRHGTVIESLEGLETLKALRAEPRMRRRHEGSSAVIAERAMASQKWSNLVLNLTIGIQQGAAAILLAWGVYLAARGQVTAGVLVASVQLNSRALAPLVTLTGLAVRFQQVRSSLASLNGVMRLPLDRPADRHLISSDGWRGDIELRDVRFAYEPGGRNALDGVSLKIAPGERIAVLGRVGSGKSTLLRLLSALYHPQEGQALLDGVDMTAIEPADIRARLLLVGQDARLFHGTLRDNLRFAAPDRDDRALLALSEATGVTQLAAAHPLGFDRPVGERGDTLSGGQRQAVALTRALLADAPFYLLDEPTSAMDSQTEADILKAVAATRAGFVVVTHKTSLLSLTNRIIVMDQGRIVADGPREAVIEALGEGKIRGVSA